MTHDPDEQQPYDPGPPREVSEDATVPKAMHQWVVYKRPKDFPNSYVARRWDIGKGDYQPSEIMIVGPDLESIRRLLPIGMIRTPRQPEDDSVIVEVWI